MLMPKKPTPLQFGVPQGYVLGPLLHTICTLPLGDILREAGVYDDSHLCLSFKFDEPSSQVECLDRMQICVLTNKEADDCQQGNAKR